MDAVSLLGYVAGTLTTVAFVPQVARAWKTKSTKDLSLGMYATFCSGVFCWWLYGWFLHSWPIVITNALTFALAMSLLALKIKHG
jgi:MtN3 and saliva related transmembrane protein